MTIYPYDEVYKKTLEYFNNDILATDVWIKKYALKNKNGELLESSPTDMHHRLAKEFARIEQKYSNPLSEEEIFNLLDKFKYIVPQGSPMAGIGNNNQFISISNCYVVNNESDSYGGICLIDQELIQLMKRRGGVGIDLSHIRPKGSPVKNSALTSTGIVPFMERFSNSTREVSQDGRRGALIITCFHPDTYVLLKDGWIQIKNVLLRLKNNEIVYAWTHEGYKEIIDYQEIENRDIYEITTMNGKSIKVTADHKFVVRNINTKEEYLKSILDIDPINEDLVFYEE